VGHHEELAFEANDIASLRGLHGDRNDWLLESPRRTHAMWVHAGGSDQPCLMEVACSPKEWSGPRCYLQCSPWVVARAKARRLSRATPALRAGTAREAAARLVPEVPPAPVRAARRAAAGHPPAQQAPEAPQEPKAPPGRVARAQGVRRARAAPRARMQVPTRTRRAGAMRGAVSAVCASRQAVSALRPWWSGSAAARTTPACSRAATVRCRRPERSGTAALQHSQASALDEDRRLPAGKVEPGPAPRERPT
jgi:hypothetical protein